MTHNLQASEPASQHHRWTDLNLWLLLGCIASMGAWLVPDHRAPWPAFYSEVLAAAGLLPLGVWAAIRNPAPLDLPRAALFVLGVAAVPLLQFLSGQIRYWGDAAVASLYLLALAVTIAAGARWARVATIPIAQGLSLTTAITALLTLGLAIMQWLQVDSLGTLLASQPPDARPSGNIAQANHMATLEVWGLLGIWLLFENGRIRGSVAFSAALLLLVGVSMTQSRTGWVNLTLLAGAAVVLKPRFKLHISVISVWALGVSFILMVISWSRINQAMGLAPTPSLQQRVAADPRLQTWEQFATALEQSPWVGYGWAQGDLAQQAAVPYTPPMRGVSGYAHNIVLDLLTWNGVPLGVIIVGAALIWGVRRAQRIADTETALLGLALLTLAVHAMFEYPHAYAYFLLPAGLMVGVIEARASRGAPASIPRWPWFVTIGLLAGALVWTVADYRRIEESLLRYRFEAARIGTERGSKAPDVQLLTQLGALMRFVRTEPSANLTSDQLNDMKRVVARFPSTANHFRLALALARNGSPALAAEILEQMCALHHESQCAAAMQAWTAVAHQDPLVNRVALGGLASAPVR